MAKDCGIKDGLVSSLFRDFGPIVPFWTVLELKHEAIKCKEDYVLLMEITWVWSRSEVGRYQMAFGKKTEIKTHNFGYRTAQRYAHKLSNYHIFRNGFGRYKHWNRSKRINLTYIWIQRGNGYTFQITDRDMRILKMPIGLFVNTCISLYSLCTRCRTSNGHIHSIHSGFIKSLNSWIRMTMGTGWII